MFTARCACELLRAERTWFVTLTLRRNMKDTVGYRLIQRYLKRLRSRYGKQIGAVRYACVAELGGKNGRLHYHMLLHGKSSLTERMVRSPWSGGISEATLVRRGSSSANVGVSSAWYLTKAARYLTKAGAVSRLRFSQGYGSQGLAPFLTTLSACLSPDMRAALWCLDVPLRIAGVSLPRKLVRLALPPYEFGFGSDEWREAEETREALLLEQST